MTPAIARAAHTSKCPRCSTQLISDIGLEQLAEEFVAYWRCSSDAGCLFTMRVVYAVKDAEETSEDFYDEGEVFPEGDDSHV